MGGLGADIGSTQEVLPGHTDGIRKATVTQLAWPGLAPGAGCAPDWPALCFCCHWGFPDRMGSGVG